jgi:Flp pilus assembly protein TadD
VLKQQLHEAQNQLERATNLFNEGKFAASAAISAAIVARNPAHAAATHLLGLAVKETGDWAQGEQWLRQSIRLEPSVPEFHANLANLLRRREKYRAAERFYRSALKLAPGFRAARRNLALTLNDLQRPAESEAECRQLLASDPRDPETWVLLGLSLSQLGHLTEAVDAYRQAIALDPGHRIAHHNLGALLSQLDKPEAAMAALETAGSLGEQSYEMSFNRARALLELNELQAAEREFDRAVALQPINVEGQLQLARVRFMLGDPHFARALAAACRANRDDISLQLLFAELLWRAGNLDGAEVALRDILVRKGFNPQVQATLASVLHEAGRLKDAEAQALQAATAAPADEVVIQTLVSVLLSRGCPADAVPFIDAQRLQRPDSQVWLAYQATAARMLNDETYSRLCDYDRLVKVYELQTPRGWSSVSQLNAAAAAALAERHRYRQHPLDQSLRNGTQSTRSLLNDTDPAIEALIAAFADPIAEYRRHVGVDPGHPMSARNVGTPRFSGLWSVRLWRLGFHVNHFHPDGWISSAYYIDVPPESGDETARSGWLKFGEPRYPVPGVGPERFIRPIPGRLVLFPSYLWHGTTPIHGDAQRLTMAFDVVPQSPP